MEDLDISMAQSRPFIFHFKGHRPPVDYFNFASLHEFLLPSNSTPALYINRKSKLSGPNSLLHLDSLHFPRTEKEASAGHSGQTRRLSWIDELAMELLRSLCLVRLDDSEKEAAS